MVITKICDMDKTKKPHMWQLSV